MAGRRLRLYRIDANYMLELSRHDHNVLSCRPEEGKTRRPFVGVVVVHGRVRYCIPLSSPKPKHEHMRADRDFSKILDGDGKLIGVLNFNSMVPVNDSVLLDLDLKGRPSDSSATRHYKQLMIDQLRWCNDHRDTIVRKASKLYEIVTVHPEGAPRLVRRCCDFKLLESILHTWRQG